MSTEFLTQLVILATAVVGLYKAATYTPGRSKSGNEHTKSSNGGDESGSGSSTVADIFEGLVSFIGIFAFMLVMPAFIWAFVWITSNIGGSSSSKESAQYKLNYEVPTEPSNIEMMLISASQIPYESARGEALKGVSDFALKQGEIEVATAAAVAIPYESARGKQLQQVISHVKSMPPTVTPNKALNTDP